MGYNLSLQDFWQYNPNTNTWCQVANYGGGTREYAPAFVIGNKGYVGTGCKVVGTSYVYYKDFWEFTPAPLTPSFPAVTNVHCFGNSTGSATVNVINGIPAYTYSWSTVPIQTTQTATGLSAGTYSVFVKDSGGCVCADTLTITTRPPMLHSFPAVINVNCFGNNSGNASVNVSGGTPAYSYSWNSIPVQTTQTATALYAGTYSVTVTDSYGCSFADTVKITSPTGLTALSPVISNVKCFGNSDGIATVSATGGTPNYTYSWNPTAQTNSTASGLGMNVYTVTITDNNSCIINTLVSVTQPTLLTAIISSDTSICSGTNATDNIFASGGTPGYNYLWTLVGSTSSNVTLAPSVTTTYTAQVTDANGCTHSASTKVIVIPTPAALFQSSLDTCSHCLQLADKSTNAISWHWNFGDNDTSNQQNPNHCFATEGVYNVTLTVNSSPQCKNTLSFSDSVFGYKLNPIVPNVFSPNGDGINDVFKISGLDKCSSYSIKIYNRWGIPIYETEKTDFSWDGKTSAGTNAEDGTYYYILTNKTTTRKGFVTLLR